MYRALARLDALIEDLAGTPTLEEQLTFIREHVLPELERADQKRRYMDNALDRHELLALMQNIDAAWQRTAAVTGSLNRTLGQRGTLEQLGINAQPWLHNIAGGLGG